MARPKKTAQNVHAKRRAQERHGLQLNKRALREIVEQIRSNKARFIVRSSHRAKVFAVMVNGKEIAVVYDNKSHTIVTFLPEDARELQWQGSLSALPSQETK